MESHDAGFVVQLFIFLTVIANLIYQWFSDERKYRREKEWEERTRRYNEGLATTLATKTEQRAVVLERKIDENTAISVKAFAEANDVNNKIQSVTKEAAATIGKEVAREVARKVEDLR